MNAFFRKILKPFALLYGGVTATRNRLYDKGLLKSRSFEIPIINVGNLSVGGTGKTPHIEYLIRLLQDNYRVATLSRGYKRKSKGFFLANKKSSVYDIGDEPFQYYKKFDQLTVAVCEKRVVGVQKLLDLEPKPDVILLDDAFQHRQIQAGLNIVLTPYDDLFIDDCMLPSGNLREPKKGISRAQLIIVTKCPALLSENEQFTIAKRLNIRLKQTVFFSTILYDDLVYSNTERVWLTGLKDQDIILVTGIANPEPLVNHLKKQGLNFKHLAFSDHHNFTSRDISVILEAEYSIILTTEKDFVRLHTKIKTNLYYLPIKVSIMDNEKDFNLKIEHYVEQSARNR